MINLKIDPEFQSQIPPLTNDEFKQLAENILKEGKLISPLIRGGIWDWNSGSIFRLIIRTLLYLSCCAGSSSRKKDATFCFAVFSLSSSSLASLYLSFIHI